MDNYATHTRVEVRDWCDASVSGVNRDAIAAYFNARGQPADSRHFTPTSGSWLNLVEPRQ